MKTKFTKDALIAALEARLPEVRQYDIDQYKAHVARNKAAAKARREHLRTVLKWDDDKLAEARSILPGEYGDPSWPKHTSCPLKMEGRLVSAIEFLRFDSRKTITVDSGDTCGALLTWSPKPVAKTVC